MKVSPPTRLTKNARKKFHELKPYFVLNSPLMVENLAMYCELWETYTRAQADLVASSNVTVNDGKAEHGAAKIQFKCLDSMRRLMNILQDNGTQEQTESVKKSLGLDD